MSAPGERDITLKLYGLDHMNGEVYADVFAKKVSALIAGLRRIDKAKNGSRHFDYTVVGLKHGSTEFALHEVFVGAKRPKHSPSVELASSAARFARNDFNAAHESDAVVKVLYDLCQKAGERFSYGVLTADQTGAHARVDPFLGKIINQILLERSEISGDEDGDGAYFRGSSYGSFVGTIEEVDVRAGDLRSGHFILSAGSVDIRCIFEVPVEEILIQQRVLVKGEAVYDGTSSIPARIIIHEIEKISGSLREWIGQGTGDFERPEWHSPSYSDRDTH